MPHTTFQLTSHDGVPLHGQVWETERAPRGVVCLVHGLGEHSGRYGHVGVALKAAGYALLATDLRGHGRSGGPRGHTPSYDALLEDVGLLLGEAARRYPATPRFLYGHSLGGTLVLHYALRRRSVITGVVASAPLLRTGTPPAAWKPWLGNLLYDLWPSFAMSNGLERPALSRDSAVVRAYNEDPLVHDRVSARLGIGMLRAGEWCLQHASEFPLPLLLLQAAADRIVSPRASEEFAAAAHEHCTLRLWEGLYHELHNEPEQAQVLACMVQWLDEHTRAG